MKFSRDFSDEFRDRRRYELEAEVRLAELSRLPSFPINVPAAYFADFNHESGTGLLITQRIAFGGAGIEPLRRNAWITSLPTACLLPSNRHRARPTRRRTQVRASLTAT